MLTLVDFDDPLAETDTFQNPIDVPLLFLRHYFGQFQTGQRMVYLADKRPTLSAFGSARSEEPVGRFVKYFASADFGNKLQNSPLQS